MPEIRFIFIFMAALLHLLSLGIVVLVFGVESINKKAIYFLAAQPTAPTIKYNSFMWRCALQK